MVIGVGEYEISGEEEGIAYAKLLAIIFIK
jgi:hypothetical protein